MLLTSPVILSLLDLSMFSLSLLLTVNFRQPSHEFTFGVGIDLISKLEDHVWFEDRWMVASLCDE
jgi:hypothetical protein